MLKLWTEDSKPATRTTVDVKCIVESLDYSGTLVFLKYQRAMILPVLYGFIYM